MFPNVPLAAAGPPRQFPTMPPLCTKTLLTALLLGGMGISALGLVITSFRKVTPGMFRCVPNVVCLVGGWLPYLDRYLDMIEGLQALARLQIRAILTFTVLTVVTMVVGGVVFVATICISRLKLPRRLGVPVSTDSMTGVL